MKISSLLFLFSAFILVCCQTSKDDIKENSIKELSASTSEITCPKCEHKELEDLPTTSCLIVYDCKNCGYTLRPKGDDCCVFCSHGTHKCPSIQEQSN